MHWPVNAWFERLRLGACDPAQHRVGGLGAERDRRLAAHPQRQVRRGRRIAGGDDARVVDAGQRLVGEQAADARRCVRPLRAARSGTPKPAVQIVTALGSPRPSASTTASGSTSVTVAPGPSMTVTPSLRQPLGDRAAARRAQIRSQHAAADQRDASALLGELGGRLEPGGSGADHTERRVGGSGRQARRAAAAACSNSRYGISEFGGTGHRRRGAGAADGVDEVVVAEAVAGGQFDAAGRRRRCVVAESTTSRDALRRATWRSRPRRRRIRSRAGAAGSARRTSAAG